MMNTKVSTRVAVTGLGIITAVGESLLAFEEGIFNGKCGIGPVSLFDTTGFPCQFAAQVKKKDLEDGFEAREIKRISRCDILGLIAAREAIEDSGLDLEICDRSRIGIILGGGAGGMLSWEQYRRSSWSGQSRPKPSLLLPFSNCTLTDLIAGKYSLSGPRATISTACSSSATSIGYGFDLIRSGDQDIVVAGGSEALSELTFAGFNAIRAMDPEYCRPLIKTARGCH